MQTITKRFLKMQLRHSGGHWKDKLNDGGSHAAIEALHSLLSRSLPDMSHAMISLTTLP